MSDPGSSRGASPDGSPDGEPSDPAAATDAVEVDCRGQRCPQPVIALARASQGLADGTVLAVLATDPAAATDIPAWCRMRGHEFLGTHTAQGGVSRFLVRIVHRTGI